MKIFTDRYIVVQLVDIRKNLNKNQITIYKLDEVVKIIANKTSEEKGLFIGIKKIWRKK